ncbi:hypothetical protein F5972_06985 [Microbispora cellulosiformans]|uniref:Uncharacterized protein n=1 Tax=Microbispora cellulosiformans TaxID=2614688 RepID=A0A5J5KB63_9ACTN|nr:hypothetical protein [Microbispora cellulosiformans]KAA9380832.1 hypothetical protein F5972_06985 [Microbispora cellulosiformans]
MIHQGDDIDLYVLVDHLNECQILSGPYCCGDLLNNFVSELLCLAPGQMGIPFTYGVGDWTPVEF